MKKIVVSGSLLLASYFSFNLLAQETKNKQGTPGLEFEIQQNELTSYLQISNNSINPSNALDVSLIEYPVIVGYQLVDKNGRIVQFGEIDRGELQTISFDLFNSGEYYLHIMDGKSAKACFVSVYKQSLTARVDH